MAAIHTEPARPSCTEHSSCTLPAILRRQDVDLIDHPAAGARPAYTAVLWSGRVLGTMVDRGFPIHANHGGGWYTKWEAFAGGGCVLISQADYHGSCERPDQDREYVARCIIEHATRAAFHFRMALHSCG